MHNAEQMGKMSSLPSDAADKMLSMQAAIDQLSAELSKVSEMEREGKISVITFYLHFPPSVQLKSLVSAGLDAGRLEELGSQLAQLRERMGEVDRAVDALTATVSSQRQVSGSVNCQQTAKAQLHVYHNIGTGTLSIIVLWPRLTG